MVKEGLVRVINFSGIPQCNPTLVWKSPRNNLSFGRSRAFRYSGSSAMNLSGNRTTNGLVIFRAVSQLTERFEQATLDSSHALFGQSVIVGVYRHCITEMSTLPPPWNLEALSWPDSTRPGFLPQSSVTKGCLQVKTRTGVSPIPVRRSHFIPRLH